MTLNLNLFIYPGGHHEAAWRYPASEPDRILDIKERAFAAYQAEGDLARAAYLALELARDYGFR